MIEVLRQARRHGEGRGPAASRSSPTRRRWTCRRRPPAWSSELKVKVGDKVSEGSADAALEAARRQRRGAPPRPRRRTPPKPQPRVSAPPLAGERARPASAEVRVPDIGDFKDVPVIEVFVKPGDTVKAEDPLVTLESDKATMDVPAPLAGTVEGDARQGRRQGDRRRGDR